MYNSERGKRRGKKSTVLMTKEIGLSPF